MSIVFIVVFSLFMTLSSKQKQINEKFILHLLDRHSFGFKLCFKTVFTRLQVVHRGGETQIQVDKK